MRSRKSSRLGRSATTVSRWYTAFSDFNIESLFARSKVPGPPRSIFVNQDLPPDYFDPKKPTKVKKEHLLKSNQVISSKYTIITFVPRNLLEQFRRVANIFFLGINILQFFHEFATISPGLVILPLLVILAITAVKDGYEDIKRHQSDRHINHSQVRVLSGGGWVNPNAVGAKSKTFVKGSVPLPSIGSLPGLRKKRKSPAQEGEVQIERSAAPPEAIDIPMGPVEEDTFDDIEFDDEDIAGQIPVDGQHLPNRNSVISTGHSVHSRHSHTFHFGKPKLDRSHPHWKKTAWEDLRVGDFVKLRNGESFPADILICATSEEENVCYIETKNLDGETNLKSRNAVAGLTHLRTAAACADKSQARFRIDCDRPDPNLYKLNAAVIFPDAENHINEANGDISQRAGGKYPVDSQTVLLRGTVLKNTKWVIGVVMFTGEDTKIILNSSATPSKRSRVEKQMDPQVIVNLVILALMATVCGIADAILEQRYYPEGAPWLFADDQSDDNPRINGLVTWAFALITFQNIIPISLYISIEFVRTVQAALIYYDKQICYDKTDQPTIARNFVLSDDLGQIEYIFSDKTGTLTQNLMIFRQCSVGGKKYTGTEIEEEEKKNEDQTSSDVAVTTEEKDVTRLSSTSSATANDAAHKEDATAVPSPSQAENVKLAPGVFTHFHDSNLQSDIAEAIVTDNKASNATHARALNGFFSVLALCHTVIATVDPNTGELEYKAQSPDEAALVQAAADVGFVFRGRDREVLRLQTPFSDHVEEYELLNVLDFTSARKRMSVILRKMDEDDSRIFLFTKGADNVIFERLKADANEELKLSTEQHLDEFASMGLRTLTLAYKVIPEDYYESWSDRYNEATVALDDRESKTETVSSEIEQDLRLLGATAIEDRLQDGVPEAIADLKRAGIKVWVATGDKLETAIAIGYSTNLIANDSNLIVVRGGDPMKGERTVRDQLRQAVDDFFPESNILDGIDYTPDQQNYPTDENTYMLRRRSTGISSIVGQNNGEKPGGFVLVIEGSALTHAFADEIDKEVLLRLSTECEAVICCRVSPLQKAQIVRLVKDGLGAMTLAIGDGANDVSMIQAADVGVGINGEEGLQAVNSSDYAIAQFRFLKRLLLVHGHWSYARNGTMIVNFFYKNIVCIGVLWWFQIYCAWSSQYVFEYTYLLFWNVFWTLCPVIAIGLFDRIIDDDVLMAIPELYRYGREHYWYGYKPFFIFILEAVYQSVIIFFFILYAYDSPTTRRDGYDVALYEFSTTMVLVAVMAANSFNGLNTAAWTGWVFFAVLIGIVLVWVYTAIYSVISPTVLYVPVYGNDLYLFHSAIFWFSLPLVFCLALLPRYLYQAVKFMFAPTDIDVLRYIRKNEPQRDIAHDEKLLGGLKSYKGATSRAYSRTHSMASSIQNLTPPQPPISDMRSGSRTDMSTGSQLPHRGFDFSTEEQGVAIRRMQSNLSERRLALHSTDAEGRRKRQGTSRFFSLNRSLRKKKTPSTLS